MKTDNLAGWKNDLNRCIRCGYCFEGCPVYQELGWEVDGARGKVIIAYGLYTGDLAASDYAAEKMYQCTFCRDCVERCSAQVSIPDIISAARADLWNEGLMHDSHTQLLKKIDKSGNIFNKSLNPPSKKGDQMVLLGCRFLERNEDAKKYLKILEKLGIKPMTFDESCCGMPYAVLGDKSGFKQQQDKFLDTIPDKNKELICMCTTCVFFIKKKYPELNSTYVINTIVDELAKNNRKIRNLNIKATYHDPCNVARGLDMVDEPRWLLNKIGVELKEMEHTGKEAKCCGGGGGVLVTDKALSDKLAYNRVEEAAGTGADYLVTLCPTCELNLKNAAEKHESKLKVKNVLDLVYEALS